MAPVSYLDDPVLRLLPEPIDSFLALSPEEQAWRGRLWIVMYGAGYEPDHAWWFVMQDEPSWVEFATKELLPRVPEDPREYAAMIRARREFEHSLVEQAKAGLT